MAILRHLRILAALPLALACGTTASNSGTPTPGGAPGSACNAAATPAGCYTDPTGAQSTVSCPTDVSPATWVVGQACATGMHCAVQSQASAVCLANPATAVNDTVGGDSGSGAACVEAKCSVQIATCENNAKCVAALICLGKCNGDQTCQDACGAPLQSDAAATKALSDILQCEINAAMSCSLGADGGTTDSQQGDSVP